MGRAVGLAKGGRSQWVPMFDAKVSSGYHKCFLGRPTPVWVEEQPFNQVGLHLGMPKASQALGMPFGLEPIQQSVVHACRRYPAFSTPTTGYNLFRF